MKPGSGLKVITPVEELYDHVPSPATTNVVCIPGVEGSRSMVTSAAVAAPPFERISLVSMLRSTLLPTVFPVLESSFATGGSLYST